MVVADGGSCVQAGSGASSAVFGCGVKTAWESEREHAHKGPMGKERAVRMDIHAQQHVELSPSKTRTDDIVTARAAR